MPIRTDLALDTHESLDGEIKGVTLDVQNIDGITVSTVEIINEEGKNVFNKEIGKYITVESHALCNGDKAGEEKTSEILAEKIRSLLTPEKLKQGVLVVGLGNRNVTADSLGPGVCDKLFITRHLHAYVPDILDDRINKTSAVAPGVLGITGIETLEIVRGVADNISPGAIVAIDSLASNNVGRIRTTFQLCDTGIAPGSGIGNKRNALNEQELGVKVLGLGVPLVVFASTIAEDLINNTLESEGINKDITPGLQTLIEKVSESEGAEMIVTPKDIDTVVEGCSRIIANALNIALHQNISLDEVQTYMV